LLCRNILPHRGIVITEYQRQPLSHGDITWIDQRKVIKKNIIKEIISTFLLSIGYSRIRLHLYENGKSKP